ncbi:class I adenylate-forming enzyme family protein [Variovorax saccharolyticus]|uniref:class I adenylate-forming enzyme family protein n=1 Tax=Variovorax saccharolyticus TaxID=3053516 RepID=UPI0025785773|nr:AMP-binding protein [Variovorax sp. J22R187]MDM0021075.1 AMP-binding protein [Variovorax sp. J22R187]
MYLTQGLHRALQRNPDKTALTHVDETGTRRHTHAQLADGIARQAAALARRGIARGDRVALLSPNSDRLVRAMLACWWLGAIACPLNIRWSTPELAFALDDSEASLLLVDESFAALVPEGAPATLQLAAFEQECASLAALPDTRTGGDALAAILYTGGTTGRSKGVMLSHANFWSASMTRGAELNNAPDSVSLLVAPLFHVAGLGRLVGQSIVGGSCVTMSQFRPGSVIEAIAAHGISDIMVVPSMLQSLLDDPAFTPERVKSLDRIAFGAAPMPPDLLDRALAAWAHAEFFQAYGLTETAGAVCINLPSNHRPGAHMQGRLNSVGRAGLGAEIIVADESGRELPRGEVGEVLARGPMLMQGYWRNPEATAAAFRDGWFRTGDAGRMLPDGHLFIVDRLKDMIISGGENVYCAEVEAALRSHPQVANAAVIGVPDLRWGEAVHAVVVRGGDASVTVDELRAWCRERLAGYKCPRGISFVPELPMSAAGKVLKNLLRDRVRA